MAEPLRRTHGRRDVDWEARRSLAPWGMVSQADLQPQGEPEAVIEWSNEEHLGLHVIGTFGISLGMLAVRCVVTWEHHRKCWWPMSLAIADTPIPIDTSVTPQSKSAAGTR